MYTKPTEKINFHYLIFLIVTLICLCLSIPATHSLKQTNQELNNITENTTSRFYSYFSINNPYKITSTRNSGGSNLSDFVPESEIEEVDFSKMTKSEIQNFQKELRKAIKELENEQNETKNIEYSSIALKSFIEKLEKSEDVLNSGEYLYPYSQKDLNAVAYVIYREAGCNWLTDRHRDLVGCVLRNRKNQGGINQDLTNPSYYDIMNEDGQYPYKSKNIDPSVIHDYCYESAIRVLEYKVDCPDDLIWQATFKQGSKVYDKFEDSILGTTTYFCLR